MFIFCHGFSDLYDGVVGHVKTGTAAGSLQRFRLLNWFSCISELFIKIHQLQIQL